MYANNEPNSPVGLTVFESNLSWQWYSSSAGEPFRASLECTHVLDWIYHSARQLTRVEGTKNLQLQGSRLGSHVPWKICYFQAWNFIKLGNVLEKILSEKNK